MISAAATAPITRNVSVAGTHKRGRRAEVPAAWAGANAPTGGDARAARRRVRVAPPVAAEAAARRCG